MSEHNVSKERLVELSTSEEGIDREALGRAWTGEGDSKPQSVPMGHLFVPTPMLTSDHPVAQAWRYVDDALDSLGELPDEEPSVLAARLMSASELLKDFWRNGAER